MTDWTAGYVAELGYTYGYYTELNPQRLQLAFLNAGLVAPTIGVACELGFGQGLSTNIHAAASITQWHGTDFNPSQASFAQELARASGAQAHLLDEGFETFCQREDLPDFDYIGLHGIWSWISDANRAVIVDFIHRKLKVGGVLYISYNTQPGWAAMVPMRDLLTTHSEVMGAPGMGMVPRIDAALDFAEKLFATKPGFCVANPGIVPKIETIKKQDRHYLAHEYFNRDWYPMLFSRMAETLQAAKLDFACSASYNEHIDAINLTPEQQDFLGTIPDRLFRETVRDFMVNQQFRRDYWVKGARHLNAFDRAAAIRALTVVLTSSRTNIPLKVLGALGEAGLTAEVYNPILDLLADHQVWRVGDLEKALNAQAANQINFAQLLQALMILTAAGHLASTNSPDEAAQARQQTDKLNAHLIDKARGSADVHYLASPLTGGGVQVGRFQQLFLLALDQSAEGQRTPRALANFVWQILHAQGQSIVKDGKTLLTMEDNLAELSQQAQSFLQTQLPLLQALQVV